MYDGCYPTLCCGNLVIKVNGKIYGLYNVLLAGCSPEADSWNPETDMIEWDIDLSEYPELMPYKEEIVKIINENIPRGCCGGCG